MDVVDKIAKAEKDEKDKPTSAITIDSIEVVKDYDFSKK
ncbi:Peptidyl-prolyl cis-trans isomerase [Streptococcus oralis]|jgi:cyclophilin type peptidyl-prolyl cis-trans isomerase/CLD family protein|nr:Peptidyl-prolyl cis-trans isomerase [Streptococcus oralis]KXU00027.1 Peptidyl-prolyl cis-trans isomerase [Streptococcus oralis]